MVRARPDAMSPSHRTCTRSRPRAKVSIEEPSSNCRRRAPLGSVDADHSLTASSACRIHPPPGTTST